MEAGNTDDLLDYLKLDPDHHEKIASLIPQVGCFHIAKAWQGNEAWQSFFCSNLSLLFQETWYEVLIRYGLYLGAIFQMACIMVAHKCCQRHCHHHLQQHHNCHHHCHHHCSCHPPPHHCQNMVANSPWPFNKCQTLLSSECHVLAWILHNVTLPSI